MATSSVDCKALVLSMKRLSSSSEPWEAELRHYMHSICSSPCPVAMEAAVCYHVEKHKIAMLGQALKVINRPTSSASSSSSSSSYLLQTSFDTPLHCASEDGVMNLSRTQRRYLLRSVEQSMRRAESALAYVRKASKEQVTPAGPSQRTVIVDGSRRTRAGPKHDPHFCASLEQWYLQTADVAAESAIAEWTDPVVHALLEPSETESIQSPITPTTITASTPIVCHRRDRQPDPQTIHEYELARSTMRSPLAFSDEDMSGSDKAASGDEFATDDEHDISF